MLRGLASNALLVQRTTCCRVLTSAGASGECPIAQRHRSTCLGPSLPQRKQQHRSPVGRAVADGDSKSNTRVNGYGTSPLRIFLQDLATDERKACSCVHPEPERDHFFTVLPNVLTLLQVLVGHGHIVAGDTVAEFVADFAWSLHEALLIPHNLFHAMEHSLQHAYIPLVKYTYGLSKPGFCLQLALNSIVLRSRASLGEKLDSSSTGSVIMLSGLCILPSVRNQDGGLPFGLSRKHVRAVAVCRQP